MIYDTLPKPFFVLAPLDDVTDVVFRTVVAQCAPPDLFFTEFVNVDGLQSLGRDRVISKLQKGELDKPIIAQVWGLNTSNFETTAAEIVEMGFDGIDINMGCPEKTVVKNGACSALINNRELAAEIIAAVKRGTAGKLPVSVKTRLGFNAVDLSWIEFLLKQDLDSITIHFRTRKEMSKVPAQWHYAADIVVLRDKIAPRTKIIGNGDVMTRAQGLELAAQFGLDGIMVGRGIFSDPFLFGNDGKSDTWLQTTREERMEIFRQHVTLFQKTWPDGERKLHTLNKFCKMYIQGFDGAKELREHIMNANTADELLKIVK